LAKSLVELHGGSLEIDSAPDEGTTVTILLPREPAGYGVDGRRTALVRVA
jgi:signal transduction histidine kinase